MPSNRRVLTVVAMDVAASSQLKSDHLKAALNAQIAELLKLLGPKYGVVISKHNGDGFTVGGNDPAEMAEFALQVRHHFRTTNWKKLGFEANPKVRIALNTGAVEVVGDHEFSGKQVEIACRIEPIVGPDGVWCSEATALHLQDESDRIRCSELGERQLPKGTGSQKIYSLCWSHEADSPQIVDAPLSQSGMRPNILERVTIGFPGIKRDFDETERREFAETAFDTMRQVFEAALPLLEKSQPGVVKTSFTQVSKRKFTCSVSVQGKTRAMFQVWIANDGWRNQSEIRASTLASDNDSSFNFSYHVSDTGYRLTLDPAFAFSGDRKNLSPEDAAQHLWDEFAKQLN